MRGKTIYDLSSTDADAAEIKRAIAMTYTFHEPQQVDVSLRGVHWHPDLTRIHLEPIPESDLIGASLSNLHTLTKLAEREVEVLRLICDGLSSREIADTLNIAESTVNTHRARITEKTGVSGTAELMRWAILNDLYHLAP